MLEKMLKEVSKLIRIRTNSVFIISKHIILTGQETHIHTLLYLPLASMVAVKRHRLTMDLNVLVILSFP